MPTFGHGKNTHFALGTQGAETTPTDISDSLDEVSFPESVEPGDTTVFGDGAHTYVVGLRDSTVSLSGKWNPTIEAHLGALMGNETLVDFVYGPVGNATGDRRKTGSGLVTSFEVSSPVADVVTFSAEIQVSGPVTVDTFP